MSFQKGLVKKERIVLKPDPRRVVGLFFDPGNPERMNKIARRVAGLTDRQIQELLRHVNREFGKRHRHYEKMIDEHFSSFVRIFPEYDLIPADRKKLIGAYLSKEYSFESTALMNPSMVLFDHSHKKSRSLTPFIMSLRAVGEGHISSITFRTGYLRADGSIVIEKKPRWASLPEVIIRPLASEAPVQIRFTRIIPPGERILFPVTADECNGIEDMRMVRFLNEDGSVIYYATYTAYDGKSISIKLLETSDFESFKIFHLQGAAVKNKGLALFPNKISGKFAMISRQDGENLYIMFSKHLLHWPQVEVLVVPEFPWEFVQMGNCGSPLKTDEGWLLLLHGVGPFRTYVMSALLLDLKDPTRVKARLQEPLLVADRNERHGYVPNVVYSCGGIIWRKRLILPYAVSDYATRIATVDLKILYNRMS
jgi:predicted GH43/DUF377 family glycosyl hydrolase